LSNKKYFFIFQIVVLAVASLCLAEPEADPQFLYSGYYPYAAAAYYSPAYWLRPAVANSWGYSYPGAVVQTSRLDKREAEPEADPQLLVASPYAYTWPYAYTTQAVLARAFGPYDCVTAEGCAVQNLREHAVVKREAEAEADASHLLYAPAYYNAYNAYYNPYYYSYVPRVAPVVATVNKPVTYTHLGAHPIHDTHVIESHSAVVGHALVKREAEAEADASHLLYAPAYYNGYYNAYNAYNAYYNPYVYNYVPQVAPVVATINNPVTYTHLGAHPIQDTHVIEQHSAVVGHVVV
jgi:hypothetical protein